MAERYRSRAEWQAIHSKKIAKPKRGRAKKEVLTRSSILYVNPDFPESKAILKKLLRSANPSVLSKVSKAIKVTHYDMVSPKLVQSIGKAAPMSIRDKLKDRTQKYYQQEKLKEEIYGEAEKLLGRLEKRKFEKPSQVYLKGRYEDLFVKKTKNNG